MIGFKISHKNIVTKIGISNGVTTIHLTRVLLEDRDELDLYAGGLDKNLKRHVKWLRSELKLGDKIIIEVEDLDDLSDPIEIVQEDPDDVVLKAKLKSYKALKKELQEKGLI